MYIYGIIRMEVKFTYICLRIINGFTLIKRAVDSEHVKRISLLTYMITSSPSSEISNFCPKNSKGNGNTIVESCKKTEVDLSFK